VSASPQINLRPATEADVPLIVELVHELADYEHLAEACVADTDSVRRALFEMKAAEVIIAETSRGTAGYALFFRSFSTFRMRPGIYLEDLYVRPAFRRLGVGFALLRHLARHAVDKGYARVEWSVLNWNQLAIDFYERIGAESLRGWTTFRLSEESLDAIARLSAVNDRQLQAGG
jgi:ribosomal protein S18 acetylase RimI-like enzyme